MTSAINPNNIDGTFPMPGVSNNTQGFRTNFTNTKTNFQAAADEINDLQSKVVLKAPLTGTTLDNNMNDNLVYAVQLKDVSYTYLQQTTTSGTVTIDYSAAPYQYVTTTGSVTLAFSNWPTTSLFGSVQLIINITNTAYTLTLPAAVTLGTTGIQGYSAGVITFAATGTYQFNFSTTDGGTTVTIQDLSRPLNVYTNGVTSNSATSGIGYATGAGGSQTQSTDKTTGVTLNKICGRITMNSASLAAGAEVSFTLTNSTIAATDVVYVCIASGATAGAYNVQVDAVAAGSCRISLGNMSTGPLSEAVVLNYVVVKSVIT